MKSKANLSTRRIGTDIKVLLIEDDDRSARLTRAMLGAVPDVIFEIEVADRLSKARERLEDEDSDIDIILLDLSLPDSRGLETYSKLQEYAPDLPVVVITGFDDEIMARQAVNKGAQDYLVKGQFEQGLLSRSLIFAVQRRKAQRELQRGEARLRTYMEHAPGGVAVVGEDGHLIYANPGADRILGYEPGELAGMPVVDSIIEEDAQRIAGLLYQLFSTPGATLSAEMRCRHKDGSCRHIEATGANYLNEPAVQACVMNFHDITEHKEVIEALEESQERLRALIENAPDAMYVMDTSGVFLDGNRRAEEMIGYSKEELIGRNFEEAGILRKEYLPTALEGLEAAGRGEASEAQEFELIKKDGTPVFAEISSLPVSTRGGMEILGIARDTTRRRSAEDNLSVSEKRLTETIERLKLSQKAIATPVVQIWEKVLALPLVGAIDDHRAQQVMEVLLNKIVDTQSEMVIIDVTGVPSIDTEVANYLIQTVSSVSMMGAQCVLTGIQPDVAQTVINLGLDMSKVMVKRDMQDGLRWAVENLGYQNGRGARSRKDLVARGGMSDTVPSET
jgi:anti-anti-sigma factor